MKQKHLSVLLAVFALWLLLAGFTQAGNDIRPVNAAKFISSSGLSEPPFSKTLEIGAWQEDITPAWSVALGGYGIYVGSEDNLRWSDGAHDPLYAMAVALIKGSDVLVWIQTDLVGLVSTDVNDIRVGVAQKLSIDPDRVIVGASHTHHSPDTVGLWGTTLPPRSGRDERYMQMVKYRAILAAIKAFKARRPAKLSYAVGEEAELHFNTYEGKVQGAPIDHTVTLLKATDEQGKVIATITNWGCHPTTEDMPNLKTSADWAGPFYREMTNKYGGIHMFSNGSIGAAIQPSVPWRKKHLGHEGQGFVWAETMGKKFFENVDGLMENAKPIEFEKIEVVTVPVTIRMSNRTFALAEKLGIFTMDLPPVGGEYTTIITAVKLGDLRIGTMPGEMAPHLGNLIRNYLGGKGQILVGLGQDWLGYIIDENQYDDKIYAYEKMLCISPHLGTKVLEAYEAISFD